MDDALPLAQVVSDLRLELAAAMADAADEELRFELGPIEIELDIAVEKAAGAAAKAKFWVLEAGVDGKYTHKSSQRIKLLLTPRSRATNQPPWISGQSAPGER